MIGCLHTHVHKQSIIALYFEFESALKFYNLGTRFVWASSRGKHMISTKIPWDFSKYIFKLIDKKKPQ